MSKLATPSLAISGTTLTVSNIDDNATSIQLKKSGVDYKNTYIIDDTYTNVTASAHVGLIGSNETVSISLAADGTNYKLPESISVVGATGAYTRTSDTAGSLTLSGPTGKVSVTATAINIYSVTGTATNATINGNSSYSGSIAQGSTVELTLGADGTNYKLPTTAPTITGATGTYNRISNSSATLTLSNATGNVSFAISGVAIYSITATATNVTASASNPSAICAGETATLTFTADGTSYKVPTTMPTITGATGAYTRTSDTECTITLSNPTANVSFTVVGEAQQSYPVKGQIITIESQRYRVLSISGSHAKLFGLFDAATTAFDSAGSSNVYASSTLDAALNTTWFNNQSATFQAAVEDSSITTSTYRYSSAEPTGWTYEYDYNWNPSDPEYATRTATTSIITRKVYALDLKDYYDYKGTNTTTSNDLMMFFFEGDGTKGSYSSNYCWLRSARASSSGDAWYVRGSYGRVGGYDISNSCAVRPALTIDLSKISWS